MSIFLILYIIVALVTGYFWARAVYREGGRDIKPGNFWTAILFWVLYGATWPLWAVIWVVCVLIDFADQHNPRKLGDKIF